MTKRARYCPDLSNCFAPKNGRCPCQNPPRLRVAYPQEYYAWVNMKTRCTNPKYPTFHRYGGRGIKVCTKWQKDFRTFLDHIGQKPHPSYELDRINNDGNYEPGNVRWAPKEVNANNKSTNQLLTINGETGGLPYWESKSGRDRKTIWRRLKDGWPAAWAVMLDPLPQRYRKIPNGLAMWAREHGL